MIVTLYQLLIEDFSAGMTLGTKNPVFFVIPLPDDGDGCAFVCVRNC